MNYFSTRNKQLKLASIQAINQGLSREGGLFIPHTFPHFELKELVSGKYASIQKRILTAFFNDYDQSVINHAVDHQVSRFNHDAVTLLKKVGPVFVLELFHGPSAAFKDVALQILPHLLTPSVHTTILTATSGDTGSAALEGFKNKENIDIFVYYPTQGISDIQRKQMTCVNASNTHVFGINGNFDDAQRAVKDLFQSYPDLNLSSANSINIGRLVPQIAYYVDAYRQLLDQKIIHLGEEIVVSVPTGNFGNILAAYYAKKIGLPIKHFICASNENDVLTEVITTGSYSTHRNFMSTTSPSMDILVSSNFERLLYDLIQDDVRVTQLMLQLKEEGNYSLNTSEFSQLTALFSALSVSQDEVNHSIEMTYKNTNEVLDPHTAIAMHAAYLYQKQHKDDVVIVSATASPYKFPKTVLKALKQAVPATDFEAIHALHAYTNLDIPTFLSDLETKEEVQQGILDKTSIQSEFLKAINK